MSVLWIDLKNQVSDYTRNYTTGNIQNANVDRACNRALEYFQRRLTLPSDRRTYQFSYLEQQQYYNMPAGFNEAIGLFYAEQRNNVPANNWVFRPDTDIMGFSGLGTNFNGSGLGTTSRQWGFTTANQSLQLIMIGPNITSPTFIDTWDSTANWVATDGAINLTTNQSGPQAGMLAFTYAGSGSGFSDAEINNVHVNYNLTNWATEDALLSFSFYLGDGSLSNLEIVLLDAQGNGYQFFATADVNGQPLVQNSINTIGFYVTQVNVSGTPSYGAITQVFIVANFNNSQSAPVNLAVSNFVQSYPDVINMVYYSAYKGYTAASANSSPKVDILNFNYPYSGTPNDQDIIYFGDFAPDFIGPVAKKAAIELMPQLRQDKDFMEEYKLEVEDWMHIMGKTYPRKRTTNFGKTSIKRTNK